MVGLGAGRARSRLILSIVRLNAFLGKVGQSVGAGSDTYGCLPQPMAQSAGPIRFPGLHFCCDLHFFHRLDAASGERNTPGESGSGEKVRVSTRP